MTSHYLQFLLWRINHKEEIYMTMLGIALIIIGVIMIIKDGDSGKKDKWLNFIKESLTWASLFTRNLQFLLWKKKEVWFMILFTILVTILLTLILFAAIFIGLGGGAFIIVFGDLIVCIAIIVYIIKRLIKKKRNKIKKS